MAYFEVNRTTSAPSLAETIFWLESLLERQTSRKHRRTSDFDVTADLRYAHIAPYDELVASDHELCRVVARLLACDESTVQVVKKRLGITEHCSEITFDAGGKVGICYLKNAWEGAIKEGIGLEVSNLLTDVPVRYLCSDEVVVTERVFEPLRPEKMYRIRELPQYAVAYGVWEVMTSVLHMADRKIGNVRWNGERLANIDFGLVFYRGDLGFDTRLRVSKDRETYQQGRRYAVRRLSERFYEHKEKLGRLLLNLDSRFCRELTCHSHPAVPLKVMLDALKKLARDPGDDETPAGATLNSGEPRPDPAEENCLAPLSRVEGHLTSAFLTVDGELLLETGQEGHAFSKICGPVVAIVETAIKTVDLAGLGECSFVQVNSDRGVVLAQWAVEGKIVIASLLKINALTTRATIAMAAAVDCFLPVYGKKIGRVLSPPSQPKIIARYVCSTPHSVAQMLRLAGVSSGDIVYDLCCGDGRALIAAVLDFNADKAVGVEIRPEVAALARKKVAKHAGLAHRMTVVEGDLFEVAFDDADVVLVYLNGRGTRGLANLVRSSLKKGARIVTQGFPIADLTPEAIHNDDYCTLFLYVLR